MSRALLEKRFLNTRAKEQLELLSSELREHGAEVLEFPFLEIVQISDSKLINSLSRVNASDWLVFTSANGVKSVFQEIEKNSLEHCLKAPVAVIGKSTASVAEKLGFNVQFISSEANSEGFAEEFASYFNSNISPKKKDLTIFLLRGDKASDSLPTLLSSIKAKIEIVTSYRIESPKYEEEQISSLFDELLNIDMLIFTSSQAVKNFIDTFSSRSSLSNEDFFSRVGKVPVAALGPKTAKSVTDASLNLVLIPKQRTIRALVAAINEYYQQ